MDTRQFDRHHVIAAIEASGTDIASRDEYDIDAIVDDIRDTTGTWDVDDIDPDGDFWEETGDPRPGTFWGIVANHRVRPES